MKVRATIISGICKCGHGWEKHHLSMIMDAEYRDKLRSISPNHPPYVPEECLAHGCNETGGMKYNKEIGEWEEHCYGYQEA